MPLSQSRLVLCPAFLPFPSSCSSRTSSCSISMATNLLSSSSAPSPSLPDQKPQKDHLEQVFKYHDQTKHSLTNYARGPHGLDWANQPNPFRRYLSSPLLPLQHLPPQSQQQQDPHYPSLFLNFPTPPKPLSKTTISQFFYDSLALSAWKTTGYSTWSLRVNPSSGNLHPTEAYLISGPIPSLSDSSFVAHYAPKEHSLELRTLIPSQLWQNLSRNLPENSFFVGISSIFWREAWKYGERAFRYCNHDVGHAIAAVAIAAAALGWDTKLVDGLGFYDLQSLMGLSHATTKLPSRPVKGRFPQLEFEHPDCLLLVFPSSNPNFSIDYRLLSSVISEFPKLDWSGEPNSLSKEHVCWDIIYRTAEVVKKPLTVESGFFSEPFGSSGVCAESSYKEFTVREVVRKRRSAVDMDGIHIMNRDTFYQILLRCLPSGSRDGNQGKQLALPFRVLPWDSELHAVLFVHRVSGLAQGLYFLVRNEHHFDDLKKAIRSEFEWEKPEGCPVSLPLYRLAKGDCRQLAKKLSCHQDIAGDSCFSLGMLARFAQTLHDKRAWMYPRLFWESGVLGQVLYLEAHAIGLSATGIGCYFDDAVHDVLGLRGSEFQSLYHFTVGSPVMDRRIMDLPAYPGPAIDA